MDPSLTHALAPVVSFFVMQFRVKTVTPGPKCSNAVLVTAAATASFCTGRNAVLSVEKVAQQVCFRQVLDIISMDGPQVRALQYDTSTFPTASHLLPEGDQFGSNNLT